MNFFSEGKTNWRYLLIILFLAILLGGGILAWQYLRVSKEEIKTPKEEVKVEEEVAKSETADWETYRNEKYGFEIKYPGDSGFKSIDYTDPDDLGKHHIDPEYSAGNLFLSADFSFITVINEYKYLCADYTIRVEKTDYKDIDNWVENKRQEIETPSDYEGTMISGKLSSVEGIEIQDKVAKRITIEGGFPFWSAQVGVINNGKLYTISYLDMSSYERPGCFEVDEEQGKAKYKDIFDKLLSTFRFLE